MISSDSAILGAIIPIGGRKGCIERLLGTGRGREMTKKVVFPEFIGPEYFPAFGRENSNFKLVSNG